jgi:hypothetical protein
MSYSPLLGGFTIVLRYALRVKNELEGPRVCSALSFIEGVHIGACPKFDMVWLNLLPIPVGRRGVISSFK